VPLVIAEVDRLDIEAQLPSPLQNVEEEAPVPEPKDVTAKLPVTSVDKFTKSKITLVPLALSTLLLVTPPANAFRAAC
jgi:hypothetical protein